MSIVGPSTRCLRSGTFVSGCEAAVVEVRAQGRRKDAILVVFDMLQMFGDVMEKDLFQVYGWLGDPNSTIRGDVINHLHNLLLNEHLQWNPAVFHQFLTSISDPNPKTREWVRSCLRSLMKNRNQCFSDFSEAIIFSKACHSHPHSKVAQIRIKSPRPSAGKNSLWSTTWRRAPKSTLPIVRFNFFPKMEVSTVNGNAVVFFHTSVVTPPATNVRVVPLTDLVPRGDSEISEKTVCDAKIRRGNFPCLVLEINTGKTLDQLRKKVADNEEDYEEAALRWLKELGVQVSRSEVSAGIPNSATTNKSCAQNIQTLPVPSVKPAPPATHIVPPVLVVQSEPRNLSQGVVSTPVAPVPTNALCDFPQNLESRTAAVQNGGEHETDLRQAHSPTDEEKISTVSEPITPPSAPRQEQKGEENRHDGDTRQKLYIGNLPRDTTETEIRALFGNFGVILDIQIMVDQKSDRYFAFLTYETEGMVDVAQKNRPHTLHNQELKTRRVVPRQQAFADGALSDAIQIFVHGVQDQMTEQDVGEYFSRYGEVARVDIPNDKTTGRRLNYAFVTFKDHDVVDKIVLTGEHYLKSARLLVKKVSPSNRPALRKPQFSQSPSVVSPSRGSTSSSSSADVVVEGEYTNYNGRASLPASSPNAPYGPPPRQYQSSLYQAAPARPHYAPRGRGGTSAVPSPMRPAYAGSRGRFVAHTSPYPVRGRYSSSPRGRGSANGLRR